MKANHSEWVALSFILQKKDGQVRFISGFRRLNKQIKRTPYTLPHIKYMLKKLSNFTYATTLDLIMGCYNIFLTDAAKKICMITEPFRKYEYNHLTMGVFIAPNIFQEQMSTLMDNLYFFIVYIDVFLIITYGSFEENLCKVKEITKIPQLAAPKCKIDQCKFVIPKL